MPPKSTRLRRQFRRGRPKTTDCRGDVVDSIVLSAWRKKPSLWLNDKIDIEMTPYRGRGELENWLAQQPEGSHSWLRQQLAKDDFVLDADRSYLEESFDRTAEPGQYALQWANGCGKTTFAALKGHHFLDCYPGGILLTTAGTWSQLKEQLWREIHRWAGRATQQIAANCAPNGLGKTQIDIAPDWAAFGRASDKPDTFEGVHADAVMVIIDEAKAVPPGIFDAVRRILRGNPRARFWFICISSPGSPTGPFWEITNGSQAHRWETLRCSAYQSPRVSLDQVGIDWEDLGDRSPLFIAMVCGEFPDESERTILPISWVQACVGRTVNEIGPHGLGVDMAQFGGDEIPLAEWLGRKLSLPEVYQNVDSPFIRGRILERHRHYKYAGIAVDDTGGFGTGIVPDLQRAGLPVRGVHMASTKLVKRPDRYANIKAEVYFNFRSAVEAVWKGLEGGEGLEHGIDPGPDVGISLPADKRLLHQLTMQQYNFTTRGGHTVYIIEDHKALKTRREKSPDRADSAVLGWWARDMNKGMFQMDDEEDEGTMMEGFLDEEF